MSLIGLSAAVGFSLAAGLVMAIFIREWSFVAIFAIGLLGVIIFSLLALRKIKQLKAEIAAGWIEYLPVLPEAQRQDLNIEVAQLSKMIGADAEQIGDLQSAYIVAEDLAIRQIQQEEQLPIFRHVTIGDIPFDAVFTKDGQIICGDVSFIITPDIRDEKIDAMLRKAGRVRKVLAELDLNLKPRLMIILVTQLSAEDDDRLRKALNRKRFEGTPVDVEIRLLDFEALQRIYVAEN